MPYKPDQYWNDIFANGVDAKSVCYPEWPLSYNHFLHQQQLASLVSILNSQQINLEQSNIIEVGPGAGFWTKFFKIHNPKHYTGLEISEPSVKELQKHFPEFQFHHADIGDAHLNKLDLPSSDVVFSAMVFLHITDNERLSFAFSQLANNLKPGGYFIFLDAIYTQKTFGNAREQTDGKDFNPNFHNKIRNLEFYKQLMERNELSLVDVVPAFNSSQFCFDFKTYLGYLVWGKIFNAIHKRILHQAREKSGSRYAFWQNKLDHFLTKNLNLGMSSKWVIMKKK